MKSHISLCATVVALVITSAQAALIEVDSPIYGPTSLTRETTAGLEWLDLTQTVNLSFIQVSAQLGTGGDFEGFRYATLDELRDLWLSAGITDLSGSYSAVNATGVSRLVSLMGETNTANGALPHEGLGHIGLTPRDSAVANRSFLELSLDQTTARASLARYTNPVDFVLPRIGHYLVRVPGPLTLDAAIDIRPGADVNPVNLSSKGVLPVAILGAEDFDVNQIDLSTATLDGASPRTKGNSGDVGSFEDINGDLFLDLILHFDMRDMNIDPRASTLILTGELLDGTEFEGSDSIRIVPPGDMDGDGLLTSDDIALFVLALADGDAYLAYWGLDANIPGDCDGDGVLTADDIHSFVDLLTGRVGSAIPEPAMLSMFCGTAVPILSRLKRRRKS